MSKSTRKPFAAFVPYRCLSGPYRYLTGLKQAFAQCLCGSFCQDLVTAMRRKRAADSPDVQAIIRRHFEWLKQFWTPNRESYAGHSGLIVDSDLRKAYEAHDPKLPEFASAAMEAFAETHLA